jgi:hypothetical protein
MTKPLPGVWAHVLELSQELGLACFAVAEGAKVPAISKALGGHGVLDATTLAEQVVALAMQFPRANYGVATGGWRNLFVIDFDNLDALPSLTQHFGERAPTPTVHTPRGRHEYFLAPPGLTLSNSARRLAAGVDTRGHGGYVVGAGSRLADGRGYSWADGLSALDLDFAPLPTAVIDALLSPPPKRPDARTSPRSAARSSAPAHGDITARVARYLREIPTMRDGEGRNAAAYRIARHVVYTFGGSSADAQIACDVWNRRNAEPLADSMLARIIANAVTYGGRRHAA